MAQDNKPPKVDYHALKKADDAQAKSMGQKDVRFDVMDDGTFRRTFKGRDTGRFTERALKSGLEARGINDSSLKKRQDRKRKRSNITNNQGFDFGVYDDNDDFTIGSTGSGGGSGGSGGGGFVEPNQDINPTSPFSITVDGSTDGEGVQTSPFTIDCIGGTGEYPAQGTGTTPQSVDYPSPTGVSVSPSTGTTIYRIIAKVSGTMTASSGMDVSSNGTIIIEEGTAIADKLGSNTRYVNNGSNSYDFFFMIGTVTASRRTDGLYRVTITQVQEGNYSYGNTKSTTATAGGQTISTKDGLRKFTICINGEPFTCDVDVSNIVKVT